MNVTQSVAPSILAFVTTLHLALVVLRAHRSSSGSISLITAISVLFAASPWLLPSYGGLAVGFAAHVAWFIACERLLPVVAHPRSAVPARPGSHASAPAPAIARLARQQREFVQTPVMAVFDESADTKTFRMVRPEGFEFTAGQFLTVRLRTGDREHVRCYSISSPPGARGHLEITVKRIGMVSGALHAMVRPGAMLTVRPPAGSFVYPAADDRPLVLIAGGVGITPLMSMLRHATDAEPARPITLFYSVRTVADLTFRDELALLERRHAHLRVFIAVTGGEPGIGHFPGRINAALISTMVPDAAHAIWLLCGPQSMLDEMKVLLGSLGIPEPQIRFEVFQAAVAASAGRTPPAAPASRAPGADAFQVRFERSQQSALVSATETLLEAAEGCGADIPSLCRAGVCGTCRTRVIEGDTDCASSVIDPADRDEGYVLPCVTRARSDCRVDA